MQTYKSYEYNYDYPSSLFTSWLKLLLLMGGRWLLWGWLPPAEGVEHPEEGDGHVDEDDQGEQGVGDAGVGANSKSGLYWDGMINELLLLVSRDLYRSVGNVLNMFNCFRKEYSTLKAFFTFISSMPDYLHITEQILTA